ncbi:hypothetical protein FNF29_04220 [Cafeteria roenbergensis]|uniref:Uncharacterized protein n=1 Tax=Cafeteria roenbergensis TaxID=33653 RepID=A0A5A8CGJ3_CAFRO|nr:hypothetical protein FNF29_04220 [Cafeteria roenbergensis]|eukprot:KAA0152106.1 hypothetical protein FNF29_04220 [Cafeteria roenbergensis]
MVSGADAYAATCSSLDWLSQGGSEDHARQTLITATDGILATHGHSLAPEGMGTEELLKSVESLRAKGATVVAVAPEALEVPRDPGAGDAAGLQLHIWPEDVVIPVCETGLGMSQILHVVLSDVAREANWRTAAACRLRRCELPAGRLVRVGLPHGALRGFDSPGSLAAAHADARAAGGALAAAAPSGPAEDALADHELDFPPVDDDSTGSRVTAYIQAVERMSKEALCAEARLLDFAPESEFASLAANFAAVFGRGTMPRAGQQLADRASIGPLLCADADRRATAAASPTVAPRSTLAAVVAARRAVREMASATLYAAPFLRGSCHAVHGATKYARTVLFVVGKACGPVANRLVEVATRLRAVRQEWGQLGGVTVVFLPMPALEAQLADASQAVNAAEALLETLKARRASKREIGEADDDLSVHDSSLQVAMAEAYRALARVIRAYVPAEWMR